MPLDATKIHQGPGKLWLGALVPATGSRLIIDATGAPTQGSASFAGATLAAMTLALAPKLEQVAADQVSSPIDVIATADAYEIDTEMLQSDLNLLRQFIVLGTYASGTDSLLPAGSQQYEEIAFGGIIAIPRQGIAVISPRRDAASKYIVSMLYQAYQAEAVKLPMTREKKTTYKIKFIGLADATRPVGDQVGKVYRQL